MQLHQAIVITPELRAMLDDARMAMDRRANADRAVAANQEALRAAEGSLEELKANVSAFDAAAIHAEAAASVDSSKKPDVTKAVKAADRAAAEFSEKQREVERRTAAQDVLNDSARAADEAIASIKSKMTGVVAEFRGLLQEAFAADLIDACKPLTGVLQAAREINNALPNGFCRQLLENTKVLDPRTFRFVSTEASNNVTGTDLLFLGSHPLEPMPPEAQLALREINEVSKALAAHRAFVPPAKTAVVKPYRVQSSSVTEQKRTAASRSNEVEWAPPASTWQAQSWGPGNNGARRSTRAATEVNVAASLNEHGVLAGER